MSFKLTSPAFEAGQPIPARYTCQGENLSPPLHWSEFPLGTRSLVLIMDDPDAPGGVFNHWLVYNLPPTLHGLPEGVPHGHQGPEGSHQGTTSWRRTGYGGPCPPSGTHRYFLRLYALDTLLDSGVGASKEQVLNLMRHHILGEAELMGTYRKH